METLGQRTDGGRGGARPGERCLARAPTGAAGWSAVAGVGVAGCGPGATRAGRGFFGVRELGRRGRV
eukprot:5609212-Alexandrium_andersonii.AAC.1